MTNPLTILVIEDTLTTQVLLQKSLGNLGHTVITADNGQQGVELYQQHHPDIVLTDINMPVMNGLEAIKHIRSLSQEIWVPILILSASEQDADIISGLEAGADDYLAKPINLNILHTKINVMKRFVVLQQDNARNVIELKQANNELEEEQLLAKQLAGAMLGAGDLDSSHLNYWLCPNSHFSGDLIAASQADDDTLFVMLADSTGHGLAAALPTMIIARAFHATTKKGLSLTSIIKEMNNSAKSFLPANRFVASNVFAINFRHKTIESWCGGLPDSVVLNQQGERVHTLTSNHLALGILPSQAFDASTELWHWQEPVELFTYSDGVTEANNPDGDMFGTEALLNLIQTQPEALRFSTLKQAIIEHLQADNGQDDISILSVKCH